MFGAPVNLICELLMGSFMSSASAIDPVARSAARLIIFKRMDPS